MINKNAYIHIGNWVGSRKKYLYYVRAHVSIFNGTPIRSVLLHKHELKSGKYVNYMTISLRMFNEFFKRYDKIVSKQEKSIYIYDEVKK